MSATASLQDAKLKSFLVLLPAMVLAVWISSQLASEEFILPVVILTLFVILVFFLVFNRVVRYEASIIGLLIVGYLVGNRGFAELAVFKPLYFGEIGLAAICTAALLRYVVTRETIDTSGPLARCILIFLFAAFARLLADFPVYHLDALRDSAMVYYALFFFAARQVGQRLPSRMYLERCLRVGFLGLAIVSLLHRLIPDVMENVSAGGYPLFYQKDDLVTTFAATGSFFLFVRPDIYGFKFIRFSLIIFFIVFVFNGMGRASLLGLILGSIPLWIANQRRYFLYPLAAVVLGITVLTGLSSKLESGGSTSGVTVAIEKFQSMADFSGANSYNSEFGQLKSANNEFRRVLWKFFVDDTMATSPLTGRGFGYDFVSGFTSIYQHGEWVGLRSAHNYYVTLLGRMGIVGLLIFLAITWCIVREGVRAALAARRGRLEIEVVGYWCIVWAILISAMVGVVLEGPIGGILFWSFLGLAVSGMDLAKREQQPEVLETVDLPNLKAQGSLPRPAGRRATPEAVFPG